MLELVGSDRTVAKDLGTSDRTWFKRISVRLGHSSNESVFDSDMVQTNQCSTRTWFKRISIRLV